MDLYSVAHGPMLANFRENGGKIVLDGVEYDKGEGETMPRYLDRVQQAHMGWMREQEYQNERKRKQEAEKGSKEGSVASASNNGAVGSERSGENDQSNVQAIETPLDDIIKTKIAYYLDRLRILAEKEDELDHRLKNIYAEVKILNDHLFLARMALEVYIDNNNNKDNNKQVIPQEVGGDLSGKTIEGWSGESPQVGQQHHSGVGSSVRARADGFTNSDYTN